MAEANLQDNFEQRTDGSQLVKGGGIVIGTGPGGKSVVFQNDVGEIHLAANPTAGTVTLNLPQTGGTLIMSGQAVQGLGVSTIGNTLGNTGTTIGTIVFAGLGGVTLSQSTAVGSLATITISGGAGAACVTAIGVSTGGNTSGDTGTTQGTYVLVGGNNVTLSQATNASGATVTISGMDVVEGLGVSTLGNTAGNTGTTLGTVVFAGIGNITLSQSTAAGMQATITISGGPAFRSYSFPDQLGSSFGTSNGGLSLMPFRVPYILSATKAMIVAHMSGATGSTGALTVSLGVYTLSGSTASLASSASVQLSWTGGTGTTASSLFGGQSGTQYRTLSLGTWAFTPGDYLFGFYGRTSNAGSWTMFGPGQTLSIANAQDTNQTNFWLPGFSTSSFTTGFPGSINITDTNFVRTGISAYRQVGFLLQGTG